MASQVEEVSGFITYHESSRPLDECSAREKKLPEPRGEPTGKTALQVSGPLSKLLLRLRRVVQKSCAELVANAPRAH